MQAAVCVAIRSEVGCEVRRGTSCWPTRQETSRVRMWGANFPELRPSSLSPPTVLSYTPSSSIIPRTASSRTYTSIFCPVESRPIPATAMAKYKKSGMTPSFGRPRAVCFPPRFQCSQARCSIQSSHIGSAEGGRVWRRRVWYVFVALDKPLLRRSLTNADVQARHHY